MPVLVPVGAVSKCASMLLLQTPVFGGQYWESLVHTCCLLWRLWVSFLSNHAILSMLDPTGPKGTHLHEMGYSPLWEGVRGLGYRGAVWRLGGLGDSQQARSSFSS